MSWRLAVLCVVLAGVSAGCSDTRRRADVDAGRDDAGFVDGGGDGAIGDGGAGDAGLSDSGASDGGALDARILDSGATDSGLRDTGTADSAPSDSGVPDAGPADTGPADAGGPDTGPPGGGCISGAAGRYVARFRWDGSGSGSTAYVRYEAHTLPDGSRWRVTAASRSIGYRPVFVDPFLGDGGLDLSGTVFIDVELSTVGLSSIRNVTIAIRGRSYNTTTSGSFTWQTFTGTGAAPRNLVSNSAPYAWYGADATSAFVTGDSGVLLRIQAGPASNALVVNRVEICFDAS